MEMMEMEHLTQDHSGDNTTGHSPATVPGAAVQGHSMGLAALLPLPGGREPRGDRVTAGCIHLC